MADDLPPEVESVLEEYRELRDRDPEMRSMPPARELSERPRGILSIADREYLVGQREYEYPQSEANRKQDIRKRTVNAILDFALLAEHLPEGELEKVFNELYSDNEIPDPSSFIISFLYRGLDGDLGRLEDIIEEGIYTGANSKKFGRWSGKIAEVNTSIDVEQQPNLDEVIKKFEQGDDDQLTPVEIGILVRTGQLDEDDLSDLERSELQEPYVLERLTQEGIIGVAEDSDTAESTSEKENMGDSK